MSIVDATAKVSKPVTSHDRAHDVPRSERHPLDAIFAPRSVAVIGATERQGSIGRAVLWSLVSSPFGGTVYPVSDKRASVLGIKAYRRVADIPELVDLAVVVTPAATGPGNHRRVRQGRRGGAKLPPPFGEKSLFVPPKS